ncbi:MAG: nuclear transport factor 2 family protein [Planctomycetota bacterium]|nr:nuclear transport factor 2 family protein [Planctomycetota bacterium]
MKLKIMLLSCLAFVLVSAASSSDGSRDEAASIDAVLTDFHDAAAKGDFDRYFGHFTDDAIFFGTDPGERWTVDEFKGYAKEPFADGHGWTYHLRERNIFVAPEGHTAWFDEIVESDHYGKCRGTGSLIQQDGTWKITQYNLVIPVPNDFAEQVVAATKAGIHTPRTIVVVRHAEKVSGPDPVLSETGKARVLRLQLLFDEWEFGQVFSSDYNRTRETAQPFATHSKLELKLYDPGDPHSLVELMKSDDSGSPVFVAGHSNTVPALLRAMGLDEVSDMSDREYDHVFIVRLDELGRASLTHLRF